MLPVIRRQALRLPNPHHRPSLRFQSNFQNPQAPFPEYLQPPHSNHQPPPPPKAWHRHLRSLLYATISLLGGYYAEKTWMQRYYSFPVPLPGTPQDEQYKKIQMFIYNRLSLVKRLQQDPEWREWEAYSNFSQEERRHRLTSGPLGGARGLAVQRIWWNETTKEALTFVCFGPGAEGLPNTVHGGAVSTVMDESLGRVALRSFPAKTGVTANLDINFRKNLTPGVLYVIRAKLVSQASSDRKAVVMGEIRFSGQPESKKLVEATGLFVVPKGVQLKEIGGDF